MNDDDIVLQPDAPKTEDVNEEVGKYGEDVTEKISQDVPVEDNSASPRIFDFSSDFNISPVSDETPAPAPKAASILVPKKPIVPTPVPQKPVATPAPQKSINLLAKDTPTPQKPVATSYREPVEQASNWPFSFGKSVGTGAGTSAGAPKQPVMNPSASAAASVEPKVPTPPVLPSSIGKNAPSSQPVKTIKADGGEQNTEKTQFQPKNDLQRDVSAILPNLNGKGSVGHSPNTQPNPKFAASDNTNLKPLRTYEGDVAEVLAYRKISSASMAIAENKKKTGEARLGNKDPLPAERPAPMPIVKDLSQKGVPSEKDLVPKKPAPEPVREQKYVAPPQNIPEGDFKGTVIVDDEPKVPSHVVRNISLVLLSLILIGGGGYGAYYLYSHSALGVKTPAIHPSTQTYSSNSLVRSDSQTVISTDGLSRANIVARIKAEISKPQDPNTVKEIVLTQTVDGVVKQISPADAGSALNIAVPDVVIRTLKPKWMLGVYTDLSGTKNVFVAANTDSFQNVLSGMLHWEGQMPIDLNDYITYGTTTTQGYFIDEIVKNKDVRAYVTPGEEKTVFLYSLVNNSTVVVADTEVALSEVVTRLENQAFVR